MIYLSVVGFQFLSAITFAQTFEKTVSGAGRCNFGLEIRSAVNCMAAAVELGVKYNGGLLEWKNFKRQCGCSYKSNGKELVYNSAQENNKKGDCFCFGINCKNASDLKKWHTNPNYKLLQETDGADKKGLCFAPTQPPSASQTSAPTGNPSDPPTDVPTKSPSTFPSRIPSEFPSASPSKNPSKCPSGFPSPSPSNNPSRCPSGFPTGIPSRSPSKNPSKCPSGFPSPSPTKCPSSSPSKNPSPCPSGFPSSSPTKCPSSSPSKNPSPCPSGFPSSSPTKCPSSNPSRPPTGFPSPAPTDEPTTMSPTTGNPTAMSPTTGNPTVAPVTPTDNPSMSPSNGNPTVAPVVGVPTRGPVSPTKRPTKKKKHFNKVDKNCNEKKGMPVAKLLKYWTKKQQKKMPKKCCFASCFKELTGENKKLFKMSVFDGANRNCYCYGAPRKNGKGQLIMNKNAKYKWYRIM